jgi:uncharacterized membrane protein YciS (DUF1049 family)
LKVALNNITLTLTWPIFGVIYVRDTGRRPKQKKKKKNASKQTSKTKQKQTKQCKKVGKRQNTEI